MLRTEDVQKEALKKLLEPFKENQIGKLPKPTKKQTEIVNKDFKKGIRCKVCKQWHHPDVIHLDYVGHAALTSRLLEVDPLWNWEPLSADDKGFPCLDKDGGMWINLTVCGLTRLGYGDAQGKSGSNATKERIGDALRNAAMRFGCALDLWHKGDLYDPPQDQGQDPEKPQEQPKPDEQPEQPPQESADIKYQEEIDTLTSGAEMTEWWNKNSVKIGKDESEDIFKKVSSYWAQTKQMFIDKESQP